jgi:anti-sigma factor RsiW
MTHLNTLQLHQLRYGELTGDPLARVRAHLDTCPACAARLRAQEAERAAFVLRPVPPAIRALATPPPPARALWLELLAGLFVAAAIALAVQGVRPDPRAGAPEPEEVAEVRFRGELPSIEVWARGPQGPHALAPGETVSSGQVVQLKYDPHGASSIALAGRDGSGRVEVYTTHAPTGIGLVTAPFALTLDDAGGDQELFVVGSTLPLDEALVRMAVSQGVAGARVARVRLVKR